jgi:GNAT superfamily N-acetyltransferase
MPVEITIREFQAGDETSFRRLNQEWIVRYFGALEAKDEEVLSNPLKILRGGGRVFFAVADGETIGCCALVVMGPGEFEVAKMAVTESWQGAGVGRQLLQAVIAAARDMGASRLFLETNHVLTPAIHLYESLGFRHIPHVPSPYVRSDVSMELLLAAFADAAPADQTNRAAALSSDPRAPRAAPAAHNRRLQPSAVPPQPPRT